MCEISYTNHILLLLLLLRLLLLYPLMTGPTHSLSSYGSIGLFPQRGPAHGFVVPPLLPGRVRYVRRLNIACQAHFSRHIITISEKLSTESG